MGVIDALPLKSSFNLARAEVSNDSVICLLQDNKVRTEDYLSCVLSPCCLV